MTMSNEGAKTLTFDSSKGLSGGVEKLLLFRIEGEVSYADAPRVACGGIPEDDP